MKPLTKRLVAAGFATLLTAVPLCVVSIAPAQASEIKYVVNKEAITSYDIQKRAAFLKLQHRAGASPKQAADDMVDQTLKSQEMARRSINISKAAVDSSFAKFAASNKMTTKQLTDILD